MNKLLSSGFSRLKRENILDFYRRSVGLFHHIYAERLQTGPVL